MELEFFAGAGRAGASEPLTTGFPFPRGAVADGMHWALQTSAGTRIPVQFDISERWSDGSVRWALLDFIATRSGSGRSRLVPVESEQAPAQPVSVSETSGTLVVDTGAARFVVPRRGPFPFASVVVDDREQIDACRGGLSCTDDQGRTFAAAVRCATIERSGPVRATLLLEGDFGGGPAPSLRFFARLHFYAGFAATTMSITLRNPRRAAHPGGTWELGDAGSLLLRAVSLAVARPAASGALWSAELDAPLQPVAGPLEIYQESSGGENWRSPNHRTRDGTIPMTFRGYRVRAAGSEHGGLRSVPRVVVHDGQDGVSASVRRFWENFPMAIEASDGVVTIRLFAPQFPAPHELQGGEQKTYEVSFVFGERALTDAADVFRAPSFAAPTPSAFAASGAVPYLLPAAVAENRRHALLLGAALEARDGFVAKRERFDEYGWRHFGEIPADHEGASSGDGAIVSHYNNQYDAVYGAFAQFARGGDARWFALMDDLARHVADIDLYHTDQDEPWYNHGLFWPTVHYVDAGLSTHRTYPRGTSGGGPDNEHNYTTGLRAWWLLTGNPIGREASLDGARRAIASDDGNSTRFRWLDRGPTGFSSKTRAFAYHGPGRGSANSVVAFLDAWGMTGDEKWLAACDELIRRTVHPQDDVAARDLLDAENRWSYTVYLQAIGRYLDERAESGRLDAMYAYARESLLTYARWMAEHEQPTLAQREKLEFPTETWPAQDLRKAEVFCFAALHSRDADRARFHERARWFLEQSLLALEGFSTRTYARPLVLLSRFGPMVDWLEHHPEETRPVPPETPAFGRPVPFIPQRDRAIRRARDAFIAAALAGAGFALARILS